MLGSRRPRSGSYALGVAALTAACSQSGPASPFPTVAPNRGQQAHPAPAANNTLWYIAKAPHPNAAKLYVNWVLSKEGSALWSKNSQVNARRVDVPVFDELTYPKPGVQYLRSDDERLLPEMQKTQDIAKSLLD